MTIFLSKNDLIRGIVSEKAAPAARKVNEFLGANVISPRQAQKWFQQFRAGRNSTKRKLGSGRPSTVDKNVLAQRLRRHPESSCAELSVGHCHKTTTWRWLRKSGRRPMRSKWVAHRLTDKQKQRRLNLCLSNIARHRRGYVLNRLVTCDESYILHGPLYWELLAPGTILDSNRYINQLRAVDIAYRIRRQQGQFDGPLLFHHDNAPPHRSHLTTQYISQTLNWNVLPHPPYSPNLAPSDYHLFLSLKNFLRGRRFTEDAEVEEAVGQYLTSKIGTDFFRRGIRKLPSRWRKVVRVQGNYFVEFIDYSVITFLCSNKQIWDRIGTNFELSIEYWSQSIWDVLSREIWPIIMTNIRHLVVVSGACLNNLRRQISPTILTDLDQLRSIEFDFIFPAGIADDGPNATAGQALTKWLHTPSKNGQAKAITSHRATTSVSYKIQLYFYATTTPIEPFELVNERTKEKLTLKQSKELEYNRLYNWLLKRCPIGETATAPIKFALRYDNYSGANLNTIRFDLWGGNLCIGPLSPPAEEEDEEADQSNGN
ncbi:hypothetical protein niasHT_019109 [Heterodera trifolii]|uniref:Mos1 transposase HTH domain-containing protein n=1 Tax=Heterodera trifolii TaxID=157864 RepID=A0ABD2KY59_9BILA